MTSRNFVGVLAAAAMLVGGTCGMLHAQEDLHARLEQAAKNSQLDAEGLKPWHLKLEVQLLNQKGQADATEILEEWWAGPQKDKRVYSGAYSGAELRIADGFFRSGDASGPPYLMEQMRNDVVHPLRAEDLREGVPDRRKEAMGKVPMDCIMLGQPLKNVAYPPLGLFPTYCFDRDKDTLRIRYEFGGQLSVRNNIGQFQGVDLAIDTTNSENDVMVAKAHVMELGTFPPDDARFAPGPEMRKANEKPALLSSGVAAGLKTGGQTPLYPQRARQAHISGTVTMHAVIGRDGRVHSLRVVGAPDPDLAIAAIAAVRTWTYKPYTLNGEITETDTTIMVNFTLESR